LRSLFHLKLKNRGRTEEEGKRQAELQGSRRDGKRAAPLQVVTFFKKKEGIRDLLSLSCV
jgi:hypothetical protein